MSTANANTLDGFWAPRRALTLAAARRHTERISRLRIFLIGLAGLLVGVTIYFLASNASVKIDEAEAGDEAIRMTNPTYSGLDGSGTPYTLTADFATRELGESNIVDLSKPVLSFKRLAVGDSSTVTADRGEYDSRALEMVLRDNVVVTTDDGYICNTSHARILTSERIVIGDEPIRCTGNFGEVSGDTYEILDDYSRFIFQNNVKATLYPDRMRDDRDASAESEEP